MRLIDIAAVLIIVIIVAAIPVNISIDKRIEAEQIKRNYNSAVDCAVKDAASVLIETEGKDSNEILANGLNVSYERIGLNKDKALGRFYQTMFINMNISKDKINQEIFRRYVPIKLVVGYEGYCINTFYQVNNDISNTKEIKEMWTPEKKYMLYDKKNNLSIYFTLEDYITVKDYNENTTICGTRIELENLYPESVFGSEFDNIRKSTILENIRNDLTYFTYLNNDIAKSNGWKYSFEIPVIDNRAINNISFIAFVQGLPINGTEKINTYGFGVTKLVMTKHFYGNETNGRKYYHTEICNSSGENSNVFDSRQEAARNGYYPCESCRP